MIASFHDTSSAYIQLDLSLEGLLNQWVCSGVHKVSTSRPLADFLINRMEVISQSDQNIVLSGLRVNIFVSELPVPMAQLTINSDRFKPCYVETGIVDLSLIGLSKNDCVRRHILLQEYIETFGELSLFDIGKYEFMEQYLSEGVQRWQKGNKSFFNFLQHIAECERRQIVVLTQETKLKVAYRTKAFHTTSPILLLYSNIEEKMHTSLIFNIGQAAKNEGQFFCDLCLKHGKSAFKMKLHKCVLPRCYQCLGLKPRNSGAHEGFLGKVALCLRDIRRNALLTCPSCKLQFTNSFCYTRHTTMKYSTCGKYQQCLLCSAYYRVDKTSHECGKRLCFGCNSKHAVVSIYA